MRNKLTYRKGSAVPESALRRIQAPKPVRRGFPSGLGRDPVQTRQLGRMEAAGRLTAVRKTYSNDVIPCWETCHRSYRWSRKLRPRALVHEMAGNSDTPKGKLAA